MEIVKIQGNPWRLTRSPRGYVQLAERGGEHCSVVKRMNDDTKKRLSQDVAGWEKEMDRLVVEARKEARWIVRCR